MTRVSQRSVSVFTGRSPNWVAKRKARKHKVILESVTQEKKKLRSVISFEAKAPPGYTFISAGDPHFTTTCKEICRRDGLKVYAVSTTPHTHTHGLSQHVHRIGYHFPSAVVADVCMDRGLYLTATGKAVSFYNIGSEAGRRNTDSASQITINTEARDVLKDLFPNIPDNDLNQIIKTAFQKGQRKVGTAVELPLARRAQLAVVAHIRHIYTNYDRLLKANSFHEARATVEQPTLAKLVEWRGDDENGKTVLEDVFREVIVISDDDDSDVEGEPLPLQGRDASVEAISSNAVVEELQMRPVNHGNPAPWEPQVEHLDDEIASGFRFIPKPPKKTNIDRRGFSRYQAWDRALNRYRNRISGTNHQFPSYSAGEHLPENRGLGREPSSHRTSDAAHLSVARCAFPNQRTVKSNLSRPRINPVAAHRFYELHHLAEPPNKRRGGAIGPPNMPKAFPLERADISEPETYSLQHSDVSSGPVFVSGPREICERIGDDPRHPPWPPGHSHSRKMDEQDHVLPSIESPLPVEIKRPNSGHIEHLTRRMSGAFNFRSVTPHRQVHQGFPKHILPQESFQAHASKRRRVAYHEPIPMENPPAPNGPITLSTHSGDRNSTGEQVSVQNGPQTRRRYVVPVEPPYIGEHALGNAEDSSISTARFDCDPQILAPYGPTKGYDGQPFSYNHHVDSQNGYHISPDQFLTAFDTRYTVTSGSGRDRIIQPRWPDQTESHISRNTQESSCNEGKAPEVTGRRFEYTRGNKDPPLYKPAEKQRLYADGFVRPIDSWEPGMLEYRQAHQLSSGHMVENLPQMANPKLCGAQKRRVTSDILPSALTRPPTHLDPLAKSPFPSQHSAAIGDQVLRHTDKLLRTPPRLSRWKTPKLKSSWKT